MLYYRWTPRKRKERAVPVGQASLDNEGQHVPLATAYLERRLRRLAFLYRGRTSSFPTSQASKPHSTWFGRFDWILRIRPLLVIVTSGLASAFAQATRLGFVPVSSGCRLCLAHWPKRGRLQFAGGQKEKSVKLRSPTHG